MNFSMTELETTQWTQDGNTDVPCLKNYGSENNRTIQPGHTGSLPGMADVEGGQTIQLEMVDPPNLWFHCPCQSTQCLLNHPNFELNSGQYQLLNGPVTNATDGPILCNSVPVGYSVTEDRQVVTVNPSEPGSVFTTLKPATAYSDADWSVFGTYSQSGEQTANIQSRGPTARTMMTLCESKSRKPCHCTRSECLKLYCECFASGLTCSNCDCFNCHNNLEHEKERQKAIKSCLSRNPDAFRSKKVGLMSGEVKGLNLKGCNCKRSGCLKNYCVCFQANIRCTSTCKCVGCINCDESSEMSIKEETSNIKNNVWPASVITPPVVESVCSCLLIQAEKAERDGQNLAQAERMVLEEFGHCLAQIGKAMFENNNV